MDDDDAAPTSASATSVRAMGAVSSSCPRERLSERVPVPAVLRPAALLLRSELARWFLAWDFWVGDFGCRQGLCVGFGGFWFVAVDLVAAPSTPSALLPWADTEGIPRIPRNTQLF